MTVNNVGDALSKIDQRTTANTDNITNIQNQINGPIGLVEQGAATGFITVGANTGGMSINMADQDGNRVVASVRNGDISARSSAAVNGSQLFDLQSEVRSINNQMSNLSSPNPLFNANDVPSSSDAVSHVANPRLKYLT
ncbi:hypothetical protein BTH42_32965 [Burkholderia sp. SRS-W-2-2016]|nr:hypothetical protein BTH42_32965 [Burkholderia sp. SRS-W-2-2016]